MARKPERKPQRPFKLPLGIPMPTGECWCGCGKGTPVGSFFAPGHDKKAEAKVISELYGNIAGFLYTHGYQPGGVNWERRKA